MNPSIGFSGLSGIKPGIQDLIFSQFGWLTTSDMDMAIYGDGCWSGYEEVGQSKSLISRHQLFLNGLGQAGKVQAQGPGPGPRLHFSCLTQPTQKQLMS